MKVIVYPHGLAIGGSQINAIDLAAEVATLGHEVIVYAKRGPLEAYIAEKGLRYVAAHHSKVRPSLGRIAQVAELVKKDSVDLVHGYEWPPCLDAFFGSSLLFRTPLVCTVLSMSVMPVVPRIVPLIMGTDELAEEARKTHAGTVTSMAPPIDVINDCPANDGTEFRKKHGIKPDQVLIVTVSRLDMDLKLDALVDAIDAIDILAASSTVRLVVVGDGDARVQLNARAAAVNQRHGREVITMAGATLDPRSAYAAADIVIGMGSSSMRAMAHAKPVVVQGERGFNAPFDEANKEMFLRKGFYGIGDGTPGGPRLAEHLATLMADTAQRATLGAMGREMIVSRFSLRAAATTLVKIYESVIAGFPTRRALLPDVVRSAWLAAGIEIQNHLPSNKRELAETEQRRLAAAATPLISSATQ
jgi:glycosyltransferase involved in cell wall biosynthesis